MTSLFGGGHSSNHSCKNSNDDVCKDDYDVHERFVLEDFIGSENLGLIHDCAYEIREQLIASSILYEKLDQCVNVSEGILTRQNNLVQRSIEVSANCERLAEEVQMLTKEADEIGAPLKHYDAVDRVGVKVGVLFKPMKDNPTKVVTVRGLAKIKVDDEEEYLQVLSEIDEACAYFAEFEDGSGVAHQIEYGRRAQLLQDAAIFLLKEAVVDRIKQTTSDVRAALNLDKRGHAVSADKLEASLVYTRFHGISSRSRRLISILQERVTDNKSYDSGTYRELLLLCQTTYSSCRESLLRSTVEAHIESLRIEHGIVGMTRLASAFLERLCNNEVSLYRDFFGKYSTNNETTNADKSIKQRSTTKSSLVMSENELQKMMNALCAILHKCVRKGLVQLCDLDTLCQVVSVLREERKSISSSSSSTIAASRTMSGVIEDAQERLIYIAQRTLQKEVMKYKPSIDDLDYPAKLIGIAEKRTEADPIEAQMLVYDTWYPPLKSVLRVLSKIFRIVDQQVFEDIALQSVQGCTKCLRDAANRIASTNVGVFDSDLFLVKHMLVLREQLSPFDVELKTIQRQLDFSEAGKAVANFLAKRNRHLLKMSNENALVMLLREGVSIQESSVDSKRDLEEALRNACNDFIQNSTVYIVNDLSALVTSCKSTDTEAISNQKFMNGEHIRKIVTDTKINIDDKIDELSKQMTMYLENDATRDILLKPIVRKISRVLTDTKRYTSMAKPGTNGWTIDIVSEIDLSLKEMQEQLLKYSVSGGIDN